MLSLSLLNRKRERGFSLAHSLSPAKKKEPTKRERGSWLSPPSLLRTERQRERAVSLYIYLEGTLLSYVMLSLGCLVLACAFCCIRRLLPADSSTEAHLSLSLFAV